MFCLRYYINILNLHHNFNIKQQTLKNLIMKATEINVNEVKKIVLENMPTYWHLKLEDVMVNIYEKGKFLNLDKEYISLHIKYTNLGKVFLDGDKFIAKSASIYGVSESQEFYNLNEAVKFAVK